ncbi:MAG: hypothetical protein KC415_04415 [Anaerolineales bacterium]|nr:hypothetical protein [Anaerolineales bacterium]
MFNSIDDYHQSLLDRINASPIVRSVNVVLDKRTLRAGFIRGDLFFADGSRLYFRELVELQSSVVRHMYSYHYQREDFSLIFRYDDTAHFPNLPGFPHHKHVGDEVQSAEPPDLTAVLQEIESHYPFEP